MHILKTTFVIAALCGTTVLPVFAQAAAATAEAGALDPNGTFVDSFGSSFSFALCGEAGTDLCGTLVTLEGDSATEENLAFVGQQVMQLTQTAPNEWKGALEAGGISADATVTQVGPDTMDIQGCRAAVLCQTLSYNRA